MRKATVATMSFVTIIVAGLIALLIWSMRRGREGFAFKNREFTHMKIYFGKNKGYAYQRIPETFYFNDADVQKVPPGNNNWFDIDIQNSEVALYLARMYSRDFSRIQEAKKKHQQYNKLPDAWLMPDWKGANQKQKLILTMAQVKKHTVSLCNVNKYGAFVCT